MTVTETGTDGSSGSSTLASSTTEEPTGGTSHGTSHGTSESTSSTSAPDPTTGSTTGAATAETSSSGGTGSETSDSSTATGEASSTTTGEEPAGCLEPTDSDTAGSPTAWSRSAGVPGLKLLARRLAVDPTGAVVISDRFRGALDLGDASLDVGSDYHYFLVKYDGAGQLQWSFPLGGPDGDIVDYDIAVDCAGNIIVAGSFRGTIGVGDVELEAILGYEMARDQITVTTDIFVAKFAPDGALMWTRQFGDEANQRALDVVTTASGGFVVVGSLKGTLDLGDEVVVADDTADGLLLEFDLEGSVAWQQSFGALADVTLAEVDLSAGGVISVGGLAAAGVDFGGGPLPVDGDDYEVFAQFEPDGQHRWSRRFLPDHGASGLAADADGAVYVTGTKLGEMNGPIDLFLSRIDATGEVAWTRYGGAGPGELSRGYDVAAGPGGHAVVVGVFGGEIDLGGGPMMTAQGDNDMFIARYGPDGALVTSQQVTGSSIEDPRAVRFGPDGELVVAGQFAGTIDFGAGALASVGTQDFFVHRFSP